MPAKVTSAAQPSETEEFQTDRVAAISAGHAVHDTYTGFLPSLLPAFKEVFALSNTQAGLLAVSNQIPSLLQPLIGHLADRVSLRYFVILAPAVTATAMTMLGVAPGYAVLVLWLVVAGLSSASLHSVGPVMAGRLSGRSLGRAMGFWMLGGEMGRFLGPLVIAAYFSLSPDSLAYLPLLMIGGWLASALLYWKLKDVPGRPPDAEPGLPWRQALGAMRPLLWPLTGIVIVRAFAVTALTTYLPTFLTIEGSTIGLASVALSILEAAGVAGALLGGTMSDRFGRKVVLYTSLTLTPVLMLLFLAAITFTRLEGLALAPLLLFMGFVALSVTPVIMALVQESAPENRALANGMYMMLGFLARTGAVVVLGGLGDQWGMRLAFAFSALVSLLGLPFVYLLPVPARRR